MDAAQLAQRLASDAPGDRAAAYAALEATDDVALAVACVAPLVALFERPAAVIGASELQRASLTLGHLVSLDCLAVGGEWFRDGKWLVLWISECNALNTILNKPTVELTVADALVCAAVESPLAAALLKGIDPMAGVGVTGKDFMGKLMGYACPHGAARNTDDERNSRLSTLVVDALREQREQLSEGIVAGAFSLLYLLHFGRPSTSFHQIKIGCVELAIAELRTMEPADWISVSRCPSGRLAALSRVIGYVFLSTRGDPGTPGVLEVYLDALTAYEQAGANDDTSTLTVFCMSHGLVCSRVFFSSDANAAAVRNAAPSIRYLLDHPQNFATDIGLTSGSLTGLFTAEAFGRDEDASTMQMRQDDIDSIVRLYQGHLTGETFNGAIPVESWWSEPLLAVSVSDHHKTLLLANPDVIPLLVSCLFLDPNHPRGLRAKEILKNEAAVPTPLEVQAVLQRANAETLQQLALHGPSKEALLGNGAAMAALEAVAERGMTEEAKEHACGALIALRGIEKHEAVTPNHVMLSYNWDDQKTIVRINRSLKCRRYNTWLDIEEMKGSIMDAMSDAVEGAEVVLYGVSKKYKESANCRLEANYAYQQGVDMVPLMMQNGYKANGWLGLILGTRLYYNFAGAESDDENAFEKRMDGLCREIASRGQNQPSAPTPASRPPALDLASTQTARDPVHAPAPAPALAPAPPMARTLTARAPAPAPIPATPRSEYLPRAPPSAMMSPIHSQPHSSMDSSMLLDISRSALEMADKARADVKEIAKMAIAEREKQAKVTDAEKTATPKIGDFTIVPKTVPGCILRLGVLVFILRWRPLLRLVGRLALMAAN